MSTSDSGSPLILFAALRADAEPDAWMRQVRQADADQLAISAIVLGLAPILAWRLAGWNVSLPARSQAKLLAARSVSRQRQQAIETQLHEILDACLAARIEPIVLKGAYLAKHVYPEPGLRPMNDIDMLVQPAELPAIEKILSGLGYAGHYKDPERGARVVKHTSSFRRPEPAANTPNPYLSAEGGRTVEPHVSLTESWYGLQADITPGIWGRSRPVAFDGRLARTLCPSDLLLHLCTHLAFHIIMGYPSLVQLVDLLMVSRKLNADDWQAVVKHALECKAAGYIYAALRLAREVLAAPVPPDVLQRLSAAAPAALRAHADSLTLDGILQRLQSPPLTTLRQRLARGVAERTETARWAPTLGSRLAVWWTLVDVTRTDTGRMLAARLIGRKSGA